jgi:nucleoside-diphosphate-sugar epimerase
MDPSTRRYSDRRVLITGVSGFLGRHLARRLVRSGAHVVGTDIVAPDLADEVHEEGDGEFTFLPLDVRNEDGVREFLTAHSADFLFHLAAMANPTACARDFSTAFQVNVGGTFHLLQHSENTARFVFLSSSAVYGRPNYLPLDELHPRLGRDPYATTKILGEDLCSSFAANFGRRCEVVRNFNTFGPHQESEYVIPSIIRQGLQNRQIEIWNSAPIRDFSFVDNTVDAILRIGMDGRNSVYNVGSGTGTRIGDLAALIAAKIDPNVTVRDLQKEVIGSPVLVAGVDRLRELGWTERLSLDTGLERTVDWFRQ